MLTVIKKCRRLTKATRRLRRKGLSACDERVRTLLVGLRRLQEKKRRCWA